MELDLFVTNRHYSFKELPPIFNEYNYFIVVGNTSMTSSIRFIFFNESIKVSKSGDVLSVITDNGSNGGSVFYVAVNNSFNTEEYASSFSYNSFDVVGCSDNLIENKDTFKTNNFYYEVPVLNTYVLSPIIEKQENIPKSVFSEMFGILPVLLVVFVGFIGIRKAISWLTSLLKRS